MILLLFALLLLLPYAGGEEKYITGKVVRKGKEGVEINVGERDGVKLGMQFQVFTESRMVYLPFAGKGEKEVLVERKPIATLVVRKLYRTRSLCEPVLSSESAEVKVGQTVVEIKPRFAEPKNVTPFIDTFTIEPITPFCGQLVRLRCEVTDANDRRHLYFWEADGGLLHPRLGVCGEADWTAPLKPGRYNLTVTVIDRHGARTRRRITVQVKNPSFQSIRFKAEALFGHIYPPFFRVSAISFDEKGRMVLLDDDARRLIFFDFDSQPLRASPPYFEKLHYTSLSISDGRYFLTEADSCTIHIYDSAEEIFKSKPALVLGGKGLGNGYFQSPPVVRIHPATGRIYALDRALGTIQVFEPDGRFIKSFGRRGNTEDSFVTPLTMEFSPDGELLVLDAGRKTLLIFKEELYKGVFPLKEPLTDPVDMRVDYFTNKIVILERTRLSVLNRDGAVLVRFGEEGRFSKVDEPSALYLSPAGTIYVSCKKRRVLKRYSLKGRFMGSLGEEKLYPLKNFTVSKKGELFLLLKDNRIARLTEDGYLLSLFGGLGKDRGKFLRPVAMGVDDDGNLYVADSRTLSITRFLPDGNIYTIRGGSERRERIDNIVDMEVVGKNIYILQDRKTYSVLVFSPEGEVTAHYPSRDFPVYGARRIGVEPSGKTYIFTKGGEMEFFDTSGQRYDHSTGIRYDLEDMLVLPTGDIIATTGEEFLLKFTPSSHLKRRLSGLTMMKYPSRLAMDGYGRLYLLDGEKSFVCRLRVEHETEGR